MSIGRCTCLNEVEKNLILFAVEEKLYSLEREIGNLDLVIGKYPAMSERMSEVTEDNWENRRKSKQETYGRFKKLAQDLRNINPC